MTKRKIFNAEPAEVEIFTSALFSSKISAIAIDPLVAAYIKGVLLNK